MKSETQLNRVDIADPLFLCEVIQPNPVQLYVAILKIWSLKLKERNNEKKKKSESKNKKKKERKKVRKRDRKKKKVKQIYRKNKERKLQEAINLNI